MFSARLFGDFRDGEFDVLLLEGQKKSYPKNVCVINEGDRAASFYVINSGKLKVFMADDRGKEITISILGQGDYFGEMGLLDDDIRSAGVMTMEESQLTLISRAHFMSCLAKYPDLASRIILGLVKRLREANKKIGNLAFLDAYGRVANVLMQLGRKQEGVHVVEEKLTHQEIANMVGISREMVSRIFRDMVARGNISVEKGRITIFEDSF
ncbi:MAG: cyclic nucleotide-binding domain-containing protein [Burkholderiales bacterium]|nr:cyclic nucleotide-binding domain-containing protein [Burkholderiales bacterium]